MELAEVKNYLVKSFLLYKNKIILFLKIAVTCGLVIFVISTVNLSDVITALENANYFLIIVALVMLVPNVLLQYWKWNLTCKSVLNCVDRKKVFNSLLQGIAAGAFTPLRLGEYFGRAFLFSNKTLLQVTIATLIDKFFPLSIVAFMGSLSSILFIHFYYNVTLYITIALFIVVFSIFYILIQLLISPEFWNNFLFNKIRKSKSLYNIFRKMSFLKNLDRNYSLKMYLISFLFYVCFVMQYVILVFAFTNQIHFTDYFWAATLVMFVKTFFPSISLSELGIREGASVFFLGQMGVDAASAFNAAFFLFLINILIPALTGSLLLFKKNNA